MSGVGPKVVITGGSGNVGTGILRRLAEQLTEADVHGICRRPPGSQVPYRNVRWHRVDLGAPTAAADLESIFAGADVVIHLAGAIQPVRN